MSLSDDVRELIGDFYDGEMTARQFREKFAQMYVSSDMYVSEVQDVFFDIDGIYAEYIMGRFDESELKKRLFDLLPSTRVHVPDISNSAEIWGFPTASTSNSSPRLPSRQFTHQPAQVHIKH